MKKSIPERSVDTQFLVDRLIACKPGEVVTYDQLSGIIGREVRPGNDAYPNLYSARRVALNEYGIAFEAVRGVGVVRLTDEAIVRSSPVVIQKAHRAAHRGSKVLACVEHFDGLTNEDKVRHNAALSVLGVIAHFTKSQSVRRIASAVSEANDPLPFQKTIEHFARLSNPTRSDMPGQDLTSRDSTRHDSTP